MTTSTVLHLTRASGRAMLGGNPEITEQPINGNTPRVDCRPVVPRGAALQKVVSRDSTREAFAYCHVTRTAVSGQRPGRVHGTQKRAGVFPVGNKTISLSKRQRVMDAYGGHCFYCGRALHLDGTVWQGAMNGDSEQHNTYCYLDHLHAQALGGRHDEANLVPCCRTCNSSKGKRTLEEFRVYQHQFAPHVRAAAALRLTLNAARSPFDANLREALAWHEAQITPLIFPGEAYLAAQKAGTQA